jgi:hypothetical protein
VSRAPARRLRDGVAIGNQSPETRSSDERALDLQRPPEGVRPEFAAVASLIPAMEQDVREAIALMMAAENAFPAASVLRRDRLIVFIEFFSVEGRICTASEYRTSYQRAEKEGRKVLSLGQLEVHYRTFANAQDHAARLCLRGTGASTPFRDPDPAARSRKPEVTLDEALDSIEWVCDAVEHWPGDGEYRALTNAQDKIRAVYGLRGYELVPHDRVCRLWGSVGDACEAAKRRIADRRRAAECDRAERGEPDPGRDPASSGPSRKSQRGSPVGKTKRRRVRQQGLRSSTPPHGQAA